MSRYSINPARLFDRPWWCGHPFRPHRGRCRRWIMGTLFVVLSVVIGGYSYLTDSDRVRSMAESYLSHLMGGRVEIGSTTLSIFEGLRLDDVKVHVDPDKGKPDSLLFSAQSFVVNYDPRKLIAGQLEATDIIAQKPHVYLTLTQKGKIDFWNYHRLKQPQAPQPPGPKGPPPKIPLPQILLRNAVVEISEVKAGKRCPIGSMDIDGQLTPVGDGERYQFEMQSRGVSERLGPYAGGIVNVFTGALTTHLRNVVFGNDIRSMFPGDLRDWWERHELAGRIESVDVNYVPATDKTPARFSVQTTVKGITLAVHREEWSSRDDVRRWQRLQDAIATLREPYRVAGFGACDSVEAVARLKAAGVPPTPHDPVEVLGRISEAWPVLLREVSGTLVFNQDGIDVHDLLVRVGTGDPRHPQAANAFRVSGRMEGYRPDAPLRLQVSSADPGGLYFPEYPQFLDSLPRDVRDIYQDLKPDGTCRIWAEVVRPQAGTLPQVTGRMEILSAGFRFRQFPYPFQGVSGTIVFGRDPFSGKDYISIFNMHGRGRPGGPNEGGTVSISGRVGPFGPGCSPEPGFDLRATGVKICSEPALMAAMPPDVRTALKVFDAPGKGQYPQFCGNFKCHVYRPPGHGQRWGFDTDVDVRDAAGRIVGFPYPCDHVTGTIHVHNGSVDIDRAAIHNGPAEAVVRGHVRWNDADGRDQPLALDLNVDAHHMPIDEDLLKAMPVDQTVWLRKLGVAGNLDVNGRIFTVVPPNWKQTVVPGRKPKDPPVLFDLAVGVKDGTVWPADGLFSVSAVTGHLHVTHDRLDISDLTGRRDGSEISTTGSLVFAGPSPRMDLHIGARNLSMDRPLYAMIPADGRKAWDEVRPRGRVDAEIDYRGALTPPAPPVLASAGRPVELPRTTPDGFRAVLKPRDLSVLVRTAPYPLTFTAGTVTITPGKAVLRDLVGSHGKARLYVSGVGRTDQASSWDLSLRAENLPADGELRKAMPPILLDIVNGLKLTGTLGFDFPKLSYRASASPSADPDIDLSGSLTLANGGVDAGMPLTGIRGGVKFDASTRQGKFDSLSGTLSLDSLNLGGRPVRDLKLDLLRSPGKTNLYLKNLRARVAGGELAGGAVLGFPDQGAGRYTMNLIVRNADVKQLAGESDQDIRGELTASLSLEGKWGDTSDRRGRGDVVVAGKQLYRIPLMLGLLQVTNLSLPIGQPFTKGTARYTVEGARVNFEQMALRADALTMNGTGYLDFGTKQVRMTLTTDNPGAFKIPFISDLWQGARQELLRINVQGTVQDPQVRPSSMGIFTTTIDQVFKGDAPKKPG